MISRRTTYRALTVACAVVTLVALAESAQSQAVLGDSGHAALLITCAVIAAVSTASVGCCTELTGTEWTSAQSFLSVTLR